MEANVSKMPSITEAMKLNSNELKKFSLESAVSRYQKIFLFDEGRNQKSRLAQVVGLNKELD